ncbi:MAG: carbohydrate kinase family protein [Clostridia bacterium]|nr:carbohydrate kinase family protein [Clostridia bacterium]
MLSAHVGNDYEGEIAISSLEKANVNTSYIGIENKPTNIMNIIIPNSNLNDNSVIHSWYSPITNDLTMNFSKNLPNKLPDELQKKEIYLILDKFLPINLEFLNSIKSKKVCLDIGHIRFFEHFTRQYLLNFLRHADYVQLNNSTVDLLFERLNVKDELELFKLLDLELLVLTKGKKGALFVFKNSKRELSYIFKSPKIIVEALDTSGAGDAFFSSVVREYAYTQKIDESFVNRSFEIANSASRDILSKTGSRK